MISRTIPQRELVDWFAELGSELVVEFPDRDDVMVKRLLSRKRDGAHPDYNRTDFEEALRTHASRSSTRSSSLPARGPCTTPLPGDESASYRWRFVHLGGKGSRVEGIGGWWRWGWGGSAGEGGVV